MAKTRGKQAQFVIIDEAAMSAVERDRLDSKRQRVTRAARLARAQLLAASSKVTNRSPERARWFCLHVHAGREFAVEAVLNDADVENCMPRETDIVVKRGQKIEVQRPFLPGYVLVRFVPSPAAFSGLLRRKGVFDFVRSSDGYRTVSDREVSIFKGIAAGDPSDLPVDKTIKQGDRAKITMGPFGGFDCVVLAVKHTRKPYARLLVDMFGTKTEISRLHLAFLKKL